MPVLLRRFLGFIVLVTTIGLATCQSMVKTMPSSSDYAETFMNSRAQVQS